MKHKILVADDEPHIVKLVQIPLLAMGHEVIKAYDGSEAWEKLESHLPSLVISDVMMPGKNGFELLELARQEQKTQTIPFIFLTARTTIKDKVKGFEMGVDDYITKPFHIQELIVRVNANLNRIETIQHLKKKIDQPEGLYGNLKLLSIPNIIQVMQLSWKTGVLNITNGIVSGRLYLKEGNLIHAVCQNLRGEDAVYRILSWKNGTFNFKEENLNIKQTIIDISQSIMLEGIRQVDEIINIRNEIGLENQVIKMNLNQLSCQDIPDHYQKVLMLIDGVRSLDMIISACPFNELLLFQGFQHLLSNQVIRLK